MYSLWIIKIPITKQSIHLNMIQLTWIYKILYSVRPTSIMDFENQSFINSILLCWNKLRFETKCPSTVTPFKWAAIATPPKLGTIHGIHFYNYNHCVYAASSKDSRTVATGESNYCVNHWLFHKQLQKSASCPEVCKA